MGTCVLMMIGNTSGYLIYIPSIHLCCRLGATVNILQRKVVSTEPQQRIVVEARVRKVPDDQLVNQPIRIVEYMTLVSR